MEILTLIKL